MTRSAKRLSALVVAAVCLWTPDVAHANGDPASDYLLTQKVFLPFTTSIDRGEATRLEGLLENAKDQKFPIRVAVILSPSDLGTAFSLINKPQKYAEFLGLELAFVYRDRLLVVMPGGYGYSMNGKPDPKASAVLAKLPPPGRDATKEVSGAIRAVQALAAANDKHLTVPERGGSSTTRDRVTIAAAATAGLALLAAIVLYRRQRRTLPQ